MLSHWNLVANAEAAAEVYAVDHKDRMLGVLPFFHSFGYTYTLWFPMLHEFAAVFHPNPTDAKTIGELAAQYRPTLFLSTPTFCLNYVRKCTREQFSTLRYLLVGAEKLRPSPAAHIIRAKDRRSVPDKDGALATRSPLQCRGVVILHLPKRAAAGRRPRPVHLGW
jgi:acyl-[acyl-carrier-protein]-phospholipid O-acyltransferase/long-chain-fatty-acid--[acyl-carrier-protein] ligase